MVFDLKNFELIVRGEEFAKFKEFSLIKKKQVNDGLLSHNGYYEWCIEQRGVIDNIMMKHGLFDRG